MFGELRKRHLVEIGLLYLGAGWLFIEITDFLVSEYGFSRKILDTVVLLAILGFPAFLVIGWFHGERGHQRVQRSEAWILVTLGVLAGVGTFRIATAEQAFMGGETAGPAAPAVSTDARLAVDDGGPDLGRRSIAVLPFRNNVADPSLDWLGSGLADLLTTDLAQIPGLRVVGRQSLYDLLSEEGRGEEEEIPESLATTVARAAGARMMIWGSVTGTAEDLAIDAQLIELENGTVVDGARVRGSDVFALVDSLAARLAPPDGGERVRPAIRVSQLGTRDLDALAAFQEGIALERAGDLEEAEAMFEKAVSMDSSFVLPLVRLAGRAGARARAGGVGAGAPGRPGIGVPQDPRAAGAEVEASQRAMDRHRRRALQILGRMSEDVAFGFEGMDDEEILAKLDSTVGRAMSRVHVVVKDLEADSLGRLIPPRRPEGRRSDGDPSR